MQGWGGHASFHVPPLPTWVALHLMRVRGSQPAFELGSWKSCIKAPRLSPHPGPHSPFTRCRPHLTVAVGVPPGNPILASRRMLHYGSRESRSVWLQMGLPGSACVQQPHCWPSLQPAGLRRTWGRTVYTPTLLGWLTKDLANGLRPKLVPQAFSRRVSGTWPVISGAPLASWLLPVPLKLKQMIPTSFFET